VVAVVVVVVVVVLWIVDDVTFFPMGSDFLEAGKKQREPIVLRSFFYDIYLFLMSINRIGQGLSHHGRDSEPCRGNEACFVQFSSALDLIRWRATFWWGKELPNLPQAQVPMNKVERVLLMAQD
jgi:hypothetical protein